MRWADMIRHELRRKPQVEAYPLPELWLPGRRKAPPTDHRRFLQRMGAAKDCCSASGCRVFPGDPPTIAVSVSGCTGACAAANGDWELECNLWPSGTDDVDRCQANYYDNAVPISVVMYRWSIEYNTQRIVITIGVSGNSMVYELTQSGGTFGSGTYNLWFVQCLPSSFCTYCDTGSASVTI